MQRPPDESDTSYLLALHLQGEFASIIFPSADMLKSMWHSGAGKSVRKYAPAKEKKRCTRQPPSSHSPYSLLSPDQQRQLRSSVAVNPGRTGGATAPPSCRGGEIRKQLGGAVVSSRLVSQRGGGGKKSLPTLAITFLQANTSSLRSNFSNADVPSAVFFLLSLSLSFYKRHR